MDSSRFGSTEVFILVEVEKLCFALWFSWIPAFAGMTPWTGATHTVIPAKAGIQENGSLQSATFHP
jgi:hypothetical protein